MTVWPDRCHTGESQKNIIPKRLMTQIVCGVSICYDNSRHFRMSDFGLSTQSLPIQRRSDLGCTARKLDLGWKAANQAIKLKRSTQYMLSIRRLTEVPSISFPSSKQAWWLTLVLSHILSYRSPWRRAKAWSGPLLMRGSETPWQKKKSGVLISLLKPLDYHHHHPIHPEILAIWGNPWSPVFITQHQKYRWSQLLLALYRHRIWRQTAMSAYEPSTWETEIGGL